MFFLCLQTGDIILTCKRNHAPYGDKAFYIKRCASNCLFYVKIQ